MASEKTIKATEAVASIAEIADRLKTVDARSLAPEAKVAWRDVKTSLTAALKAQKADAKAREKADKASEKAALSV